MFLENSTPDGKFTLTIGSAFEDEDEEIPDASMLQLVQLLEQTAQTLRLAVDPDLQRSLAAVDPHADSNTGTPTPRV